MKSYNHDEQTRTKFITSVELIAYLLARPQVGAYSQDEDNYLSYVRISVTNCASNLFAFSGVPRTPWKMEIYLKVVWPHRLNLHTLRPETLERSYLLVSISKELM